MRIPQRVLAFSLVLALAGIAHADRAPELPRADAGWGAAAPPNLPAFTVLNQQIPVNGALVLQRMGARSGLPFVVRDATGATVPGSTADYGNYVFFVPTAPWTLGMSYAVAIPRSYTATPEDVTALVVQDADLTPLPALDLTLSFRSQDNAQSLVCFDTPAHLNETARTLEVSTRAVVLDVTAPSLPIDGSLASQLFAGITLAEGPLVAQLAPWQTVHSFSRASDSPARTCAQLHVLDLRSMITSVGPAVCASTELAAYEHVNDITSALAADVCPAPDSDHLTRWCALNATRCAAGGCTYYTSMCPTVAADGGVRDASVALADAGRDAGVDASVPVPMADDVDADHGGCSVRKPGTKARGVALAALLAALFTLSVRRRRVRLARPGEQSARAR